MGITVSVSYEPLFRQLKERDLSPYQISKEWGIPQKTFYNMKKNRFVTIETLAKLAHILDSDIDDLIILSLEEYEDT